MDVKQAVTAALMKMPELFADFTDFRLEEVEKAPNSRWLITISAIPPIPSGPGANVSSIAAILRPEERRVYKVASIEPETGELETVKIRNLK